MTEDCQVAKWKHGDICVRSSDRRRGHGLGSVKPKPLLERAWVVQERFLSPRILYYGPWELLWECSECVASETEPEGTNSLWINEMPKERFGKIKRVLDSDSDTLFYKPGLRDIYEIWREIRAIYWSSQLTHHSDSLVAIAGITSIIQQKTRMHFVSGLCKEFLCSELLWNVGNAGETSRSTLSQTWSWASVKGAKLTSIYDPLMYSNASNFHIRAELFENPPDLNARPQPGGLHIYGPLLRATLELDKYGRFTTNSSRLPKYGYVPDILLPDGIEVFCLLIAEWDTKQEYDMGKGPPCCAGLILVPKEGEAFKYERVGVWYHESLTGLRDVRVLPSDWKSFRLI
ncbi:MAG: hypothetical protein Q9210_003686 [Variospora velana]